LNDYIGLDYEEEIKSALTKQHKITRDNIIRYIKNKVQGISNRQLKFLRELKVDHYIELKEQKLETCTHEEREFLDENRELVYRYNKEKI